MCDKSCNSLLTLYKWKMFETAVTEAEHRKGRWNQEKTNSAYDSLDLMMIINYKWIKIIEWNLNTKLKCVYLNCCHICHRIHQLQPLNRSVFQYYERCTFFSHQTIAKGRKTSWLIPMIRTYNQFPFILLMCTFNQTRPGTAGRADLI